jgi:translation initiation factor 1
LNPKKRKNVVFSTDPEFQYEYEENAESDTLSPQEQNLKLIIDRKGRKGKEATILQGFVGKTEDLKILGKELKKACAVGGSVKNNEVIIQGNVREKVYNMLKKEGYHVKKVGG